MERIEVGGIRLERGDVRAGAGAAGVLFAFLLLVMVIYPAPASLLFLGLVLGALSALIAIGLVLVYRANRIVNFAQGDIGGVAGVLAASLMVGPGWPFWPAVLVSLVGAVALGGLIEVAVIRRFAKAPRLLLTVATIGIAELLQFTELGLPKLFSYDVVPQPPTPFDFTFEWSPVTFRAGHLLIIVLTPIVAGGLAMFFRRTRVGVAVRASAESADRAALLGVPVKRINTLVWALAGGLSGLAVLLTLPIQGVAIGSPLGPTLLLRALAAAVIGRMEYLGRTVVAAVGLTMVEQAVFFRTGRTVVADAILFGVILVALLAQRRGVEERAREIARSTWQELREVRPIPRELARLGEVRGALLVGGAAVGAFLLFGPMRMSVSQVNLFSAGIIFAMAMISLVLLTGWAGQISLGQLAIVAFGAAVAGTLALQGKDFFVSIVVAGLAGAGVALVLGIPAVRIKGPFLAVTTLAFSLAAGVFFLSPTYFPWLVPKINERVTRPVILNKFDLESEYAYYYLVLIVFGLVCASVWRLRRSRTGRALVATRDNTPAAQSYGIGPVGAQLSAFALSGFIAGLAGGLFAFHQHGLSESILLPESSLKLFSIGVIGGLGSLPGAMVGAGYLMWVDFSPFTRQALSRLLASGAGLLLILIVKPAGLGSFLYDGRDALLRWVARRRGIVVPSLLADVSSELPASDPGFRDQLPAVGGLSAEALLSVRGLNVSYGKAKVLFGVDLDVREGEILALLGTNGAGKSTLLSAVCGLVPPTEGTVTFDGDDITGASPLGTVGRGIVLMPGGRGVFPTLTVGENLTIAGWLQRDPDELNAGIERVLELFPILRARWAERAGNLSGGEQQMLTLGQVLLSRPRLLLIDELTLGLAPVVVEQLLGIVRAIHEQGTTVVLVEQSVNLAVTLADRAYFLEKGEVRFSGPTAALLDRPEVLRSVFLQGAAASRQPAVTTANGHRPFQGHCEVCGHEHRVLLELAELSVTFGGVRAVDRLDLDVREGEIIGLIGPNGAGKTTVLDAVSGFVSTSAGRIKMAGDEIGILAPDARAVAGLGRSFQDARLFPAMTVRETIATALERHVWVRDPIAPFLLSPAVKVSERRVDQRVSDLIDLMHLGAYADKFVGELSTGTRRIVDLACILAHEPRLLLLDEPSSGIAQRETEALAPLLLGIRDQTGAALVVVEHDIPLISAISDELVAMEQGGLVVRGQPDEVIRNPRVVEGYLGREEAAIGRSGAVGAGAGAGARE